MEYKTHALVLRTVKYGDNKIIADLLTREGGRVSVIVTLAARGGGRSVYGAASGRGGQVKLARHLFQPLTLIDTTVISRPNQSLARLGDTRLAVAYTSIPFDGAKTSLVFFLAEFLGYVTRDHYTDPPFFDFLEHSLRWLDATDRGINNYHLMFMMSLTRFLGILPDVESYLRGGLFDMREGVYVGSVPMHTDYLKADDAESMLLLMRMNHNNLHLFRFTREQRNRIVDNCLKYYRLHIPAFGEMKTLEVLRSF